MAYSPDLAAAPSSERYEILSVLGRGASSIVYRALDKTMNLELALKSMRFVEHEDIYELKKEFRFFRDVYHHNLVRLFDLHVEPDACFFTMEMVEGPNFVDMIAGLLGDEGKDTLERDTEDELRECIHQFANGLAALHAAGRLHRDVKPSNILVAEGPRTVLLDFGLSSDVDPSDSLLTRARMYAGTPGYIAPERLAGEQATKASDVYGLGVVLYQSLTGNLPFPSETPLRTYEAQGRPPRAPREVRNDIPNDLSDLVQSLLSFQPEDRPSLMEVIEKTRPSGNRFIFDLGAWKPSLQHSHFVGRDAEMSRLEQAYLSSRHGRSAVVRLFGQSGVGKSSLVERFVGTLRNEHAALILRSRCHLQEFVRHKAIDGLVDSLSRYLILQSTDQLRQLCPDTLPALISVFPVLGRVQFPYETIDHLETYNDPIKIIDQASDALTTILSRLGAMRPLVIWIDDLQWSDQSSLKFLERIITGEECGNLLTILSHRSDDLESNAVLDSHSFKLGNQSRLDVCDIQLDPLSRSEIRTLVGMISDGDGNSEIDGDGEEKDELIDSLYAETDGLPYLVTQYANYVSSRKNAPLPETQTETGLNDIVGKRLSELTASQSAVLETVAVSGAPIAENLLVKLVAEEGASGQEIYELTDRLLLRKGISREAFQIEAYHDRVREAVLKRIPQERLRNRHLKIANSMVESNDPNLARLVEHYLGAGAFDEAARHAIEAARAADARYSFSDAASYYSLALEHQDWEEARPGLLEELAETLAKAGRLAESADRYLDAVELLGTGRHASTRKSLLRAKAAIKMLHSGQLSRCRNTFKSVFADLGIPFPETLRQARRASVVNRFLGSLPSTRSLWRNTGASQDKLMRANTLWEAAKGLMMQDFVVGDAVFSWYLRDAANLADPMYTLQASSASATVYATMDSNWANKRASKLIQQSEQLAAQVENPMAELVVRNCRAGIAWFDGDWSAAADLAGDALKFMRQNISYYDFIASALYSYRLSALVCQGDLNKADAELKKTLEDAKRRGDTYISRVFPTNFGTYLDLARDEPQTAVANANAVLEEAATDRFTSLHWAYFNGKANALIYQNRIEELTSLLDEQWPLIERTGFLRLVCIAAFLRDIRARSALTTIKGLRNGTQIDGVSEKQLITMAKSEAEALLRIQKLPFSSAFASVIQAGICILEGNHSLGIKQLCSAREIFEKSGMKLHAAAVDIKISELSVQEETRDSNQQAMEFLKTQRVKNHECFADMLCPIST